MFPTLSLAERLRLQMIQELVNRGISRPDAEQQVDLLLQQRREADERESLRRLTDDHCSMGF